MREATEEEREASDSIIRVRTCSAAMGRAMVELRRKRGMTQRVTASMATISENHVGKLERGEVLDPGLVSVAKMARALKTSVAPLVFAFAGLPGPALTANGRCMEYPAPTTAPSLALGAMLRTLRRQVDVSQVVLAEEAGLAPATLSRLESGKKKDPALGTLVCIAHALAWVDASVRADDMLVQLSATFAGEIDLPKDALRWLRRRRFVVIEGEIPSIGHSASPTDG